MSYSNDQISKPVTIDDLQQAVGSGSTDLATIITDGATLFSSTARWNLHKPTKGSSKLFALTDAELYALDCGLNVPVTEVSSISLTVTEDASSEGGAYFEGEAGTKICNVADKWEYKGVPTGGASDPYRISDFVDVTNNITGFQTEPAAPLKITVETVKGDKNFVDTDDPDQRPRLVYTIDASIGTMILKQLKSLNYIGSADVNAGFIMVGESSYLYDYSSAAISTLQGDRLYGINGNSYVYPLSSIPSASPWEYEICRPFNRADKTSARTFKTALCIGVGIDTTTNLPQYIVPLDTDLFASGSQAYNAIKPDEKTDEPYQINVDCEGFVHYENGHRYIYFKGSIENAAGVSLTGVKYYMRLDYSQTSTTGTKSSEMKTSETSLNFAVSETKIVYPTTLETGSLVASLTYVSYINPNDQSTEYFVRCEDPITPSQTVDDGPAYHWISIYMNDHGYRESEQVQIMSYDEYWGLV